MDPFAFNPLFCSAKPGEVVNLNMKTACKLQSHLRAKGNQGLEREKELGCPPPVLQIPSSFHLREKHGAETHRCAQLGHMLFTTRLWPSEQKSRWTHLRANTQRHTAKHAYLEPPRKHHNSYCTQRQFKGFTIYILWCFFIFIPIFLLQGSVTVPALSLSVSHTHTHTWLKDIDKICYNEPLP